MICSAGCFNFLVLEKRLKLRLKLNEEERLELSDRTEGEDDCVGMGGGFRKDEGDISWQCALARKLSYSVTKADLHENLLRVGEAGADVVRSGFGRSLELRDVRPVDRDPLEVLEPDRTCIDSTVIVDADGGKSEVEVGSGCCIGFIPSSIASRSSASSSASSVCPSANLRTSDR